MNTFSEQADQGFFKKAVNIFTEPSKTFHAAVANPDWFRPLAVLIILTIIVGLVTVINMDKDAIEESIVSRLESQGNIPSSAIDKQVSVALFMIKLLPLQMVIGTVVVMFVMVGVIYGIFTFFLGTEFTFKQGLAVYCYSSLIACIKLVLSIVVIMVKGYNPMLGEQPVNTSVTLLVGSLFEKGSLPYLILERLDFFGIWELLLWILGFSIVGNISKKRAAIPLIILYVLGSVIVICLTYLGKRFGG